MKHLEFIKKQRIVFSLIGVALLVAVGVVVKVVLQQETYVTTEIVVTGGEWWWGTPWPPYYVGNPVEKGAVEYDIRGKKVVEILDIKKYDQDFRKVIWIKAKLLATKNKQTQKYRFKQNPLEIGSTISLSPGNVQLIANVVGIDGISTMGTKSKRVVTAKIMQAYPWMADAINVGDTMKSDNNDVVAKILDKEVENAETSVNTAWGDIVVRRNPLRRDVTLKIEIETNKAGGQEYFSYYQLLKVGLELSMTFKDIEVHPVIVSFDD